MYRKPTRANEHQLSYFASRDMDVSHTLSRRFFWADNILWKEDIQGHHTTVILAARDLIVDTGAVSAYLTGTDGWNQDTSWRKSGIWKGDMLEVVWFRHLDHAQSFDRETRGKLVDIVRRYCAQNGVTLGQWHQGDMRPQEVARPANPAP